MKFYVMAHNDEKIMLPQSYILFNTKKNYMQFKNDNKIQLDGENISNKNLYYSEVSGLYYLFKNSKDKHYGIAHYRRFFTNFYFNNYIFKKLSCRASKRLLQKFDIIIPKKLILNESVYSQYRRHHIVDDLELTKSIILKNYPNFYNSFMSTLNNSYIYPYNMFVTSKKIIDEYYGMLFSIFDHLESELTIQKLNLRDNYQKRVFGFLAERIFTAWVTHKNFSVKEMNVAKTNKNIDNILRILVPSFLEKPIISIKKFLKSTHIKC